MNLNLQPDCEVVDELNMWMIQKGRAEPRSASETQQRRLIANLLIDIAAEIEKVSA